jgi:predicted ATPase
MFVTRLKLKNWRNFREVDLRFSEYTYILGANASGKSNLLDVFKFLRDVSNPQGGGLQKALDDRRGFNKIRCLHHRRQTDVRIEIHLSSDFDKPCPDWVYSLALKQESRGINPRPIYIAEECVTHCGKEVLKRPNSDDQRDNVRLTASFLENPQANESFREIAKFFSEATYLHLVPQFLKYGDRIGGRLLDDDPYGQGFLKSLAMTGERVRNPRIKKIEKALKAAVPQFETLEYKPDEMGHPHLRARYAHHRPQGAWQQEDQFSDGTLRLLGILWSLLDGSGLLLLEEPELSLNNGIIQHIPVMMQRIQKESKRRRQVIITTHSETLLSNKGIDANGIILLEPNQDGTRARLLNERELGAVRAGLSVAEVAMPQTKPNLSDQLAFW